MAMPKMYKSGGAIKIIVHFDVCGCLLLLLWCFHKNHLVKVNCGIVCLSGCLNVPTLASPSLLPPSPPSPLPFKSVRFQQLLLISLKAMPITTMTVGMAMAVVLLELAKQSA